MKWKLPCFGVAHCDYCRRSGKSYPCGFFTHLLGEDKGVRSARVAPGREAVMKFSDLGAKAYILGIGIADSYKDDMRSFFLTP